MASNSTGKKHQKKQAADIDQLRRLLPGMNSNNSEVSTLLIFQQKFAKFFENLSAKAMIFTNVQMENGDLKHTFYHFRLK